MKKNLMSVLILVLLLVNIAFTAVLTFSIVPATSNANKLIEEVAKAIHLELNSGKTTGANNVAIENLVEYNVQEGETMTINLKKGEDGGDHYCVVSVYLSLNKADDDYETYGSKVSEYDSLIKNEVISVIGSYTKDEMNSSDTQRDAQEQILEGVQALFNSDFICGVGFSSIICQ